MAKAITGHQTNLEDFDDEDIALQSKVHCVEQLLTSQLQKGYLTGIGKALKSELFSNSHQQAAKDLILNAESKKLVSLLAANDIPFLLLKGTPIAHLYYENTYQRPRCDTDIYLDEVNLDRTIQLLASNDYQLSGLGERKHSSKQFVAIKTSFQSSTVHFDMHWKLSNRVMFRSTLPFEESLKTAQPVPTLGPKASTLSSIDLMIHACIHRIAHGRNTERNRLIWLYDIHLIAEAMSESELDRFLRTAQQKHVACLCADALSVCENIFKTRLPIGFVKTLRSNSSNERSANLINASKIRWALADMQSLKGIRQKVVFAKELLFD